MITFRPNWLHLDLPIRTVSETNQREHWAIKARRVKSQRDAIVLALCTLKEMRTVRKWDHWFVLFVRVSPRKLDDDNLVSAFKAIRDQIAHELGVNDGSPQINFSYKQWKGNVGKQSISILISKTSEYSLE